LVAQSRRHYGGYLAHIGIVFMALGLASGEELIWAGLAILTIGTLVAVLPAQQRVEEKRINEFIRASPIRVVLSPHELGNPERTPGLLFTCLPVYLSTCLPHRPLPRNLRRGLNVVVRALEADGREGATFTATTNDAGEYRVAEVAHGAGRRYAATVEYQGIVYRSDVLSFNADARELYLPLAIFETTETDDALRIERAHILVEFQREHLFVTEMLVVANASDRTYIGRPQPALATPTAALAKRATPTPARGTVAPSDAPRVQPPREVLRIALPRNVSEVRFPDAALGAQTRVTNGDVIFMQPLPPQRSQIIFSYLVPRDQNAAQFDVTLPYAASAVNALVADVGAQAQGDGLTALAAVEGEQAPARYLNFGGENLPRGAKITVRISDIPGELPLRGAAIVRSDGSPNAWAFVVLALATPALGLSLWSARRVGKTPSAK
ncbi:MAG: hypothetical protein HY782_21905, partial [Chloroflexi bacterium]|nr:hypothetical protein [Chloroflexota bacterium]